MFAAPELAKAITPGGMRCPSGEWETGPAVSQKLDKGICEWYRHVKAFATPNENGGGIEKRNCEFRNDAHETERTVDSVSADVAAESRRPRHVPILIEQSREAAAMPSNRIVWGVWQVDRSGSVVRGAC